MNIVRLERGHCIPCAKDGVEVLIVEDAGRSMPMCWPCTRRQLRIQQATENDRTNSDGLTTIKRHQANS